MDMCKDYYILLFFTKKWLVLLMLTPFDRANVPPNVYTHFAHKPKKKQIQIIIAQLK